MRLSIILISWNSLPLLRSCLGSLAETMKRIPSEVIWVDNGSSDGAAEYVHTHYPDVHTILLPENKGVAYARNKGISAAKGEYILLLDDDTEASLQAIATLMSHMDTHPNTGIAGCALRSPEGVLQDSFKPYPGLICKVRNVLRSKLCGSQRLTPLPSDILHPTYVIGACQMIRRSVFDRVGLLDEAIFYGPEDADLCIRASRAGWTIDFIPDVCITHHWRRITSRSLTSPASRIHIKALIYFWQKHRRLF